MSVLNPIAKCSIIHTNARTRASAACGLALLAAVSACAPVQAGPWQFVDETRQRVDPIVDTDSRFDAVWADFNGDGCYDAFVFDHGGDGNDDTAPGRTSRLWVNRCDGSNTFTYVANEQARHYIPSPTTPRGSGWLTLLDFNGDGRQDLWLRDAGTLAARYLNGTPSGTHLPSFATKQAGCDDYCEFGDISGADALQIVRTTRRVEDMADGHAVFPAAGDAARSLIGDVTGNGWQDIIQPANHGYWRNDAGTLVWRRVPALKGNMGLLALADFDNDGAMDLLTFEGDDNAGTGHAHLFHNDGAGNFTDVTAGSGLDAVPYRGWWTGYGNVVAADFDNDGLQDLMMAGPTQAPSSVIVLRNLGNMHFALVEDLDFGTAWNAAGAGKARAAVADFDNDGRLDIVKTQTGTNLGIWRNTTDTHGAHWMKVRVRGPGLNSDGVGADLKWYRSGTTQLIAHMSVQVGNQHPQTWIHTGLGTQATADLAVRFPDDGPSYRFDNLAADQEVIVYSNGCLTQHWLPGSGWPLQPPANCGAATTPPRGHSRHPRVAAVQHERRAACDTAKRADVPPKRQQIQVHRNGAAGAEVMVSTGIPFAPGVLTDAQRVRILDANGAEVPAHVEPTLRWHFKDGSIRAVRAQFKAALKNDAANYYFAFDQPRTADAPGWAYADGVVDGPDGVRVPGALATLDPAWLSESLIAGPQEPAVPPTDYDKFVARQFEWARALPTKEASAWLFDRTTTLFKQYVRTGRLDYLQSATQSYRFYMNYLRRTGPPDRSHCGGGWEYNGVNPCDVKYVYIEPILLALALTGDDSLHDKALVDLMAKVWDSGGYHTQSTAYERADQGFTERQAGLGLTAIVSAYELTGDPAYRADIDKRVGWLFDHQQGDPKTHLLVDGKEADGAWRHSWQKHEGDDYNPATDVRGGSPWMSENIIDGLWHAWLVTADPRIPVMITAFGRYLERYGWIDPAVLAQPGHDWRLGCAGPDGQIAWYWSSSQATPEQLVKIQDSEGWFSDAHTVELGLAVAAARYFETDPAMQKALEKRLALIAHSYETKCAESSSTLRRFNWNNRGSGVVQWFVRHFPAAAKQEVRKNEKPAG